MWAEYVSLHARLFLCCMHVSLHKTLVSALMCFRLYTRTPLCLHAHTRRIFKDK